MSSRNGKSRRPAVRKRPANPSLTSLFSSVTKLSASSSGSNSTITPKTIYARQRHSSHSDKKHSASSSRGSSSTGSKHGSSLDGSKVADVFAFMEEQDEISEEEDVRGEDVDSSPAEDDTVTRNKHPEPTVRNFFQSPNTPVGEDDDRRTSTSLHSDSGISIRSNSPDLDKTPQTQRYNASQSGPLGQYGVRGVKPSKNPRHVGPASSAVNSPFHEMDSLPEEALTQPLPELSGSYVRPNPLSHPINLPVHAPTREQPPCRSTPDSRLRHLTRHISSSSSTSTIPPLYRRFETLTNTLLSQLQTDLSYHESELAGIDATLSRATASRPGERRRPTAEGWRWQRTHLLTTIGSKLDSYHRMLTAYEKLAQLPAAAEEDTEAHRTFLHLPDGAVPGVEFAYLERLEDLVRVGEREQNGATRGITIDLESVLQTQEGQMLLGGCGVLAVMLAFHAIPFLFARIAIGSFFLAGLVVNERLPMLGEDWRVGVGVYGAILVVLAFAVG